MFSLFDYIKDDNFFFLIHNLTFYLYSILLACKNREKTLKGRKGKNKRDWLTQEQELAFQMHICIYI